MVKTITSGDADRTDDTESISPSPFSDGTGELTSISTGELLSRIGKLLLLSHIGKLFLLSITIVLLLITVELLLLQLLTTDKLFLISSNILLLPVTCTGGKLWTDWPITLPAAPTAIPASNRGKTSLAIITTVSKALVKLFLFIVIVTSSLFVSFELTLTWSMLLRLLLFVSSSHAKAKKEDNYSLSILTVVVMVEC